MPPTTRRVWQHGSVIEGNHDETGVAGLHGSSDRLAKDRRTRLAEHVIEEGIVTLADIEAAGD